MIYIAGQNITSDQGSYYTRTGRLNRIGRGIWVPSKLTELQQKQLVLKHSARIAKALFGDDIFSSVSALHHGAVNGTLYLARGLWRQAAILKYFNIVFHEIKSQFGIPYEISVVRDSMGEFSVRTLTDEMLVLQAFTRQRGMHAGNPEGLPQMSITDLASIISRSVARAGSMKKFISRLEAVADRMKMNSQFRHAEVFIGQLSSELREKRYMNEFDIFWYDHHVADLRYDGKDWEYRHHEGIVPLTLSRGTARSSMVPAFIESILPETGKLGSVDKDLDYRALTRADRYISNVTIRPAGERKNIIIDALEGSLDNWLTPKGQFMGELSGMPGGFDDGLYTQIIAVREDPESPRLSGMQIKLTANLAADGTLSPAIGKPFTHIVKMPAMNNFLSLGANEWYVMTLANMVGIRTEKVGLVDLPGIGPSMIAERFDIRTSNKDNSFLMSEDLCSILGMSRVNKYDEDLLRVAEQVMTISTTPDEDSRELLKQVVFSWLTGNSDAHLKNFSMIKRVLPDLSDYESISLAPAYDVICAMIYHHATDFGLKLGGKSTFDLQDFIVLGKTLGVSKQEVVSIVRDMTENLAQSRATLMESLPPAIIDHVVDSPRGPIPISLDHLGKVNRVIEARRTVLRNEVDLMPRRGRRVKLG